MMVLRFLYVFFLFGSFPWLLNGQQVFFTDEGYVSFKSDAPLELIKASSSELRGVISPDEQTFAFSIPMVSLKGFNSPLQREHFNENYMESTRYPEATFLGRIIEDIDLHKPGTYTIRGKGMLTIHGVAQERIIKVEVKVGPSDCSISAFFTVLLADHNITVPKVVHQKIAQEIEVKVSGTLRQKLK